MESSPAYIHSSSSGNSHQFSVTHSLLSHRHPRGLNGIPLICQRQQRTNSHRINSPHSYHAESHGFCRCCQRRLQKGFQKRTRTLHHSGPMMMTLEPLWMRPSVGKKPSSDGRIWATDPAPTDVVYPRTFSHIIHYIVFFLFHLGWFKLDFLSPATVRLTTTSITNHFSY